MANKNSSARLRSGAGEGGFLFYGGLTFPIRIVNRENFLTDMETNNETKKESRECGKGEAIRRGANIQKYVDNYDRIFRKGSLRRKSG